MSIPIVRTVTELRARLELARSQQKKIAVIPTMGALHEGHLSLVAEGSRRAEIVVVTIFVNPTQFGPGEDFERYPRNLEKDTELAGSAGGTIIFAPNRAEMYPEGEQTRVSVSPLSLGLCGKNRPKHFEGVATVVAKLFNAVGSGTYLFGTKDYQQWRLIERMARDLLFPVEIVGMPIVREPGGLAMSSRNAFLTPEDRIRALAIPRALQAALALYKTGERDALKLVKMTSSLMEEAGIIVDYVEAREPKTLNELELVPQGGSLLIAVAGRLGETRLIDNLVLSAKTAHLPQLSSLDRNNE